VLTSRKEGYLKKAEEAEEKAQKAHTPLAEQTWLKIAENYRVLAWLVSQ